MFSRRFGDAVAPGGPFLYILTAKTFMKRYQKPYCGLGISFGFAPGFGEFLRVNMYKNGPPGATASPKRRENIAGGRGSRLPSISRHSGRAAAPQELPGAILPVRKKKSTVVQVEEHEPQILARPLQTV